MLTNIINQITLKLNHNELEKAIAAEVLDRIGTQELADAFVDRYWDDIMEALIEQMSSDLLPF